MSDRKPITLAVTSERRMVLLAVGALGVSCVMTQLALLRELLGAFNGNELVLGVVLGSWLLLMGLGTWLGRSSDKLKNPLTILVVMQIFVAILPLLQCFFFGHCAMWFSSGAQKWVSLKPSSALPFCCCRLPCGRLCADAGVFAAGARSGRGGQRPGVCRRQPRQYRRRCAVQFRAVRFLDHVGILVYPAMLNLLFAGAISFRSGHKLLSTIAVLSSLR